MFHELILGIQLHIIKEKTLIFRKRCNRSANLFLFEVISFFSVGHKLIQLKCCFNYFSFRVLKNENGRVWSHCRVEVWLSTVISLLNWKWILFLKKSCEPSSKSIVLLLSETVCKEKFCCFGFLYCMLTWK